MVMLFVLILDSLLLRSPSSPALEESRLNIFFMTVPTSDYCIVFILRSLPCPQGLIALYYPQNKFKASTESGAHLLQKILLNNDLVQYF